MPRKNKNHRGNPNIRYIHMKVSDADFLAAISRGNRTIKALSLELGMSHGGVGSRLKTLEAMGLITKIASCITYEVTKDIS